MTLKLDKIKRTGKQNYSQIAETNKRVDPLESATKTSALLKSFSLGNFRLQKGGILRDAKLKYVCLGKLNVKKDNLILYPTHYSGSHHDNLAMIGPDRVLNPNKYFIVIPNMFGNGVSTSPSNAHKTQKNEKFPLITVYDNVIAQRQLLDNVFGVDKISAIYGWSMGGQQAYHWGAMFPSLVERIVASCSSART